MYVIQYFELIKDTAERNINSIDLGIALSMQPIFVYNTYYQENTTKTNYDSTKLLESLTLKLTSYKKQYKLIFDIGIFDIRNSLTNISSKGIYNNVFDFLLSPSITVIKILDLNRINKEEKFQFGLGAYVNLLFVNTIMNFKKHLSLLFGPCAYLQFSAYNIFIDFMTNINISYFSLFNIFNKFGIICSETNYEFVRDKINIKETTGISCSFIHFNISIGYKHKLHKIVNLNEIDYSDFNEEE